MITVEDLGIQEVDVYDVETENTNLVFVNDILLHNSIYVNFDELVSQSFPDKDKTIEPEKIVDFLDTVCKTKMEPIIDKSFRNLAEYLNVYKQKMLMKREAIAGPALWTAKKRYVLNVWDMEGVRYSEPEIKIVGLQAIHSSIPKTCREKIKECIKVILEQTNDDVIKYINNFKKEFSKVPLPLISSPRSVNMGEKSLDGKGVPMQVTAALIYNKILKDKGLYKKYPYIKDGEKIKFIPLKKPNPFHCHVIGFLNDLPEEFDLEKYIDYDEQFNKTFFKPIDAILTAIGWKSEKVSTLSGMWKK